MRSINTKISCRGPYTEIIIIILIILQILSNIHTVKVATVDRDQRTWSFNTRVGLLQFNLGITIYKY